MRGPLSGGGGGKSPPSRFGPLRGGLVGGLRVGAVLDQMLRYDGPRLHDSPRPDGEWTRFRYRAYRAEGKSKGLGRVWWADRLFGSESK